MTQQEESSKKYAADGHCYSSSTSKKRGGAEEEPDGDEISPRFPNHNGASAAKWKTTQKSSSDSKPILQQASSKAATSSNSVKKNQGKTSQLVVKSVTVEKLPPPPHAHKKGPRSSTKKDALKADNNKVMENMSSTIEVEPNNKGEPTESSTARRRQAGQFRSNQPGAYPVGGIEDEQDGTVVVGGTTVIHTTGDEENGGMEPLPALLVGDRNTTNQDLELVHATKARGGPFRNRSFLIAVLVLVFIGVMAIGLGVGLSSNKSNAAEESDDWSIPPILVQWSRIVPLEILGSNQNDQLGLSVALSGDGSKLVTGAPLATATSPYAKVYDLLLETTNSTTTNTTALLDQTIEAPSGSGEFGYGASLSMDGSVLTIGSESGGYVVVDDNPVARPYTAGTGLVSFDSAVSADGSTVAFGLQRVAVYRYSSSTTSLAGGGRRWVQIGSNLIGDTFQDLLGWSLSLSADGNRLAAGSPGSDANGESTGSIRVYDWDGSEWVRLGSDISGIGDYDSFGVGVALSNDGRCVAGGAPQNGDFSAGFNEADSFRSGYVQVHCLQEGVWVQRGQTIAGQSDSWFGNSVDLSADGRTLIVGAPGSSRYAGEVTIYRFERDQWIRTAKFDGDEDTLDQCGFVVSLSSDGRVAAAGCPFKNTLAASSVGAVRVFRAFPCTEEDLDSVTPCRLGR